MVELEKCQRIPLHYVLTKRGQRATRLTPMKMIINAATHVLVIPGYDRPAWTLEQQSAFVRRAERCFTRAGWWSYDYITAMRGKWSVAIVDGKRYIIDGQQRRLVLATLWCRYYAASQKMDWRKAAQTRLSTCISAS